MALWKIAIAIPCLMVGFAIGYAGLALLGRVILNCVRHGKMS